MKIFFCLFSLFTTRSFSAIVRSQVQVGDTAENSSKLAETIWKATSGIRATRRREKVARNIKRATEKWQGKIERQLKKVQHNDFGYFTNKTQELEELTRNTQSRVQSLGERVIRQESRSREEVTQLSNQSNSLEDRLSKLEELLEQRTQEDYYVGMEDAYPNDESANSMFESLESKYQKLEEHIRTQWDLINKNYKNVVGNKSYFVKMKNDITRLDSLVDQMQVKMDNQRYELSMQNPVIPPIESTA